MSDPMIHDDKQTIDAIDLLLAHPDISEITKNLLRISLGAEITQEAIEAFPSEIPAEQLKYLVITLFKHLMNHDEVIKAEHLMSAVPWLIEEWYVFEEMRRMVAGNLAHLRDPDVYTQHYDNSPTSSPGAMPIDKKITDQCVQWPRWNYVLERGEIIVQRLGRTLSILDVGCWDGWVANRMAVCGHRVTGIDLDARAIAYAKEQAGTAGLDTYFRVGRLSEGSFPLFDMIVALEIYEHVLSPREFMTELAEHLAPGGSIILSSPRGSWMCGKDLSNRSEKWNMYGIREHVRAPTVYSIHKECPKDLKIVDYKVETPIRHDTPHQANLLWTVEKK